MDDISLNLFPESHVFLPESVDCEKDSNTLLHSGEILNEVTAHAPKDLRRLPPPSWSNVDGVGPEDSGEQGIVASSILPKEVQSTGTSPPLVAVPFDHCESHNACLESPMGISSGGVLAISDASSCSASVDPDDTITAYTC